MPYIIAAIIAFLLTPLAARPAKFLGLVDSPSPNPLKIHDRPIPLSGGVVIAISISVAGIVMQHLPHPAFIAGVAAALVLGLIDDLNPLPAGIRTLVLGGIGALLFIGSEVFIKAGWWTTIPALLLVVATANATNIIDGQDGLASGLIAAAGGGLAFLLFAEEVPDIAGLGLALAGAATGFWLWNKPPAKAFLGDSGAYFSGAILGFLAATLVVRQEITGILTAGICLGIFAFELVFTLGRRWLTGDRVTVGDRLHSYDLLAKRFGRSSSTYIVLAIGLFLAALAVSVDRLPAAWQILTVLVLATAGAIIGIRLWAGKDVVQPSGSSMNDDARTYE